jgi:hypothetical protein
MTFTETETDRKWDSVAVNELLDDLPFDTEELG